MLVGTEIMPRKTKITASPLPSYRIIPYELFFYFWLRIALFPFSQLSESFSWLAFFAATPRRQPNHNISPLIMRRAGGDLGYGLRGLLTSMNTNHLPKINERAHVLSTTGNEF